MREISHQTMKVVRGQLISVKNEGEVEIIPREAIKNVGKRHKKARQG
jgi:hypothetical protein